MRIFSLFLLFLFSLSLYISYSLNNIKEKEKIVISNWPGYSTLLYMENLKLLNEYELIKTNSLSENLFLYENHKTRIFAGTNYEYNLYKKNLICIHIFNISKYGDNLFYNFDINTINTINKINFYMEDSKINNLLFNKFVEKYNISKNKINIIYINHNNLNEIEIDNNSIIITYLPYSNLLKNKFNILDISDLNLKIIDGLFIDKNYYMENKESIKKLVKNLEKSKKILEKDPESFYNIIKEKIEYKNFNQFNKDLNNLELSFNNEELMKEMNEN